MHNITVTLTPEQRRALEYLLSINAHRDVEREIRAWDELSVTGLSSYGHEENEKFKITAASNRDFYLVKRAELKELSNLIEEAHVQAAWEAHLDERNER